ncbi:MAG: Holliday junction branch migration protein RuvA [Alphaproteobacteria bacterium]
MIGKLSGIIDCFGEGHLLLDVQGVGYLVHASSRTLSRIGQKGDAASMLIETVIREDAFLLYGFAEKAEQDWFKLLTSVQGVGAKAALAILAVCPVDRLPMIIAAQDKAAIQQADGVGPKLALRVCTELKDKAGKIELSTKMVDSPVDKSVDKMNDAPEAFENDAISALVNLGYARADAYTAVLKAKDQANDNLQDLIRLALKELSV